MATTRGKDGGKPAAAAQGVAPVPPQGQETTAQETAVAGERLPELTRAAYEAVIAANSDLSRQLADALGAVNELNGTVADLTAQLDAALTRATEAEGREKAALDVLDRLNATAAEEAARVETLSLPVAAPLFPPSIDERDAVAYAFDLRPEQLLSWRISDAELVAVTIAGQKIRKSL